MSKTELKTPLIPPGSPRRKIYLAGRYGRREELLEIAKQMMLLGHDVTARWQRGNEGQTWKGAAKMDVADIERADLLIRFGDPFGSSNVGGARVFEMGLATARGIECWLVGEREIVFDHLHNIKNCPDIAAVLKRLAQKQ